MRISALFVWLCLIMVFVQPQMASAQNVKLAVVDVEKMLSESKAGKSIQTQLTNRRESFQQEFTTRENDLMNSEKDMVKKKQTMSVEEFANERKAFEKQLFETRSLFQKRRNSLDKGLGNALGELRKHIIKTTAEIAEEQNFQVVLTRDSVVIIEKEMDITDQVLARLDKNIQSINLDIAK